MNEAILVAAAGDGNVLLFDQSIGHVQVSTKLVSASIFRLRIWDGEALIITVPFQNCHNTLISSSLVPKHSCPPPSEQTSGVLNERGGMSGYQTR